MSHEFDNEMMTSEEFEEFEERYMIPLEEPSPQMPSYCDVCGRQWVDLDTWELTLPPEPGVPPEYLILLYGLCGECAAKPGVLEDMQGRALETFHVTAHQVNWRRWPRSSEPGWLESLGMSERSLPGVDEDD